MSFSLGANQAIYQKTDIFDAAGNFTWNHPLPGQPIEVFVELYGGGGGSQVTSGAATGGSDTIWDTAGVATTAVGGSGGNVASPTTSGMQGPGLYSDEGNTGNIGPITNGTNHYGSSTNGGGGVQGNAGDVKRFTVIANGDINLTVGAGGTGNAGNGNAGAVIVRYNVTTTQTPVVVNQQRRDWEHFGEISWRTAVQTASQAIGDEVATKLTLNTELYDTGNKVTVNGDDTFTLEAGTYELDIRVPIDDGNAEETYIILYNETDSVVERSEMRTRIGAAGSGWSEIMLNFSTIITIPSAKTFRLDALSGASGVHVGGSTTNGFTTATEVLDRTKVQFKWRP